MLAFHNSCYSDDILMNHMTSLLQHEQETMKEMNHLIQQEQRRKDFIVKKIADVGPLGFGKRSEIPVIDESKKIRGQ
jgi:hypothetical protein